MRICPQCKTSFGEEDFRVCPFDGAVMIDEPDAADPMLGRILDGRFRIIEPIGQGGMGTVYKALHMQMDRICAIKLLSPVSPDKSAVARFRREAKMTSRIDSPNAVTIYDFGEAEPGLLFIAMEFIEGESLAELLNREHYLAVDRVVNITSQIARALAAAHSLGIIHRDLKPANIMITHKGGEDVVKVLDFGIAKAMTDSNDDTLTQTGFLLGSPIYMSPEQVLGESLDSRSDVYSLSIIVYQMLSGRVPFEGDNLRALMMKRVNSHPSSLRATAPWVTDQVERVVVTGLSRDPATRIADVRTFASELTSAVMTGAGSASYRPTITDNRSAAFEQTRMTPSTPSANQNPALSPSVTMLSPSRDQPKFQESATMIAPQAPSIHQEVADAAWRQVSAVHPPAAAPRNSKPVVAVIIVGLLGILMAILSAGGYLIYWRSTQVDKPIPSGEAAQGGAENPEQAGGLEPTAGDLLSDEHYKAGKAFQVEASLLTDAGSVSAAAAKNREAVDEYRKALESHPTFPQAHENLGVALYDLGKSDEAISEYEIAITQYEKPSAQVLTNYGMALIASKRFHDASGAFSQALTIQPADAELYYYLGFARHYDGDQAGSKEAFAKYIEVAPSGPHARDVKDMLEGRAAPSLKTSGR